MKIVENLWARRGYWATIALFETALRYRRKRLGVIWIIVPNLLFVLLVGGLLGRAFTQSENIFLYLYAGLAFWALANGVITSSSNLYRVNAHMIVGAAAPLLEFNLIMVIGQVFVFAHHAIILVLISAIAMSPPSLGILFLPLVLALLLAFLFSWSAILSCIGAQFDDLSEAVTGVMRIVFLVTPIIWSVDAVSKHQSVSTFLLLNPFFYFIELFRQPILGQPVNHSYWLPAVLFTSVSILLAVVVTRRTAKSVAIWL